MDTRNQPGTVSTGTMRMLARKGRIARRGTARRGAAFILSLFFLSFLPSDAFARGGFRGGGSIRMPSMRSAPRLSSPPSLGAGRSGGSGYTWGSSTRKAAGAPSGTGTAGVVGAGAVGAGAAGGLGGATGASNPRFAGALGGGRAGVAAQRSIYDNARRNGTVFQGKADAAQSFKSRYGSQYSSTFAAEPASRPGHIPTSTQVGGQNVNIVYNPGLGGYGYLNPVLGTWMLYDALSDAAMMDSLMYGHGYYWGTTPVYASHGAGFLDLALALFVLFFAFIVITSWMRRRASGGRPD